MTRRGRAPLTNLRSKIKDEGPIRALPALLLDTEPEEELSNLPNRRWEDLTSPYDGRANDRGSGFEDKDNNKSVYEKYTTSPSRRDNNQLFIPLFRIF